jgi:hypothetical protein
MVLPEIITIKPMKMKSIKHIKNTAAFMMLMLLVSCEKEYSSLLTQDTSLGNKANVKFYNGIMSSLRNYVYANNVALNGATIAYGGVFPALSPSYASLPSGNIALTIKDTLVTSTQPVMNFSANLEPGAYYTVIAYGTNLAPKQKVVKDLITEIPDTTARIRFANFASNATAIPNIDIFSIKRQTNIFTNVPAETMTGFIPYASASSDTLFVRATGTTTNLTQLNGLNPTAKRSYTVIFRGTYSVTTGATARTLASFLTF